MSTGDAMQESVELARAVRALGLHALLVRRAPRHGQHRQLGARDPHRARRRRPLAHPRRLGRHHAAEPHAAARGRGVSHARSAASRPHRSRHRTRARHRSGDVARAAALRRRRSFPIRCARCWRSRSDRCRRSIRSPRCAWCRRTSGCRRSGCWRRAARRPPLPARSASATASRATSARRRPGPAVRAYRAGVPAVRAVRAAARHHRRLGHLRADRRGGRVPGDVHRPGLGAAAPARVPADPEPRGGAAPTSTRRRSAWWWR